jgi:hypothetical protein
MNAERRHRIYRGKKGQGEELKLRIEIIFREKIAEKCPMPRGIIPHCEMIAHAAASDRCLPMCVAFNISSTESARFMV